MAEWVCNSQSTRRLVINASFIHSAGAYLELPVDAHLGPQHPSSSTQLFVPHQSLRHFYPACLKK